MVEGKPVFVPYALPGEKVLAEVEVDRATVVEWREQSAQRVQPFCKHYGACGGCSMQHLERSAYLGWKHDLVVQALRREGLNAEVGDIVLAHGKGRRRATLHGRAAGAGFNAARSHKVHPLDTCPILVPALASAPAIVNAIYRAVGDCDVTLTETTSGLDCAVKAQKHARAERLAGVAETDGLARIALNGEIVLMRHAPELMIGPSRVVPPPGGFLQPTVEGEEILASLVCAAAGKARHVADLFCGIGPFALRLAGAARVHAFDNDEEAISCLKTAIRQTQGIKPVTAEVRDLFREPLTAAELNAYDAVVVDPPRAGAESQVKALARSKVPLVISVSCDPATFARDARILVAAGFTCRNITPVDQFAWSAHVESVAIFRR